MNKLTEGSLADIKDGLICIEPHLGQNGIENGSRVLVIRSRSGILRVIPLTSEIVAQVRVAMDLDAFTNASRKVYDRIKNSGMRLLHSTGFCPMEDSCIWEGYFNITNNNKTEDFVKWLSKMDVVQEVDIQYLETEEKHLK